MALVPAMARDRKTARMQEQIKVLLGQGLSIRKVALALGISRQSVRKFGTDQPAEGSGAGAGTGEPAWDAAIDWPDVAKQAAGGATIKQLHSELAPEASYTRFRRRLIAMSPRPIAATTRLEHKPGEQVQIDYCDGIDIVDRVTGECRKTHPSCAALPFTSYTFR
jgi:transposase